MNGTSEPRVARFDFGYVLVLALVVVVSGWVLCMPFCRFVQRTTMARFHLQTPSFFAWAVQQPIPAMYNFYNRYEIMPPPWRGSPAFQSVGATINHFPIRMFTFGDNRAIFLPHGQMRSIDTWSSYRGEHLHVCWIAMPTEDGGFELTGEVVND